MEDKDSRNSPSESTSHGSTFSPISTPLLRLAFRAISTADESSSTPQKTKRRRRGAPKSRGGCMTCKIRHVRCDETKPICQNCTDTDRVCDYLHASHPSLSRLPVRHNLPPYTIPLKLRPNYALTTSPMISIDAQNLDYFIKVCCNDFSGFFVHQIWEQVIPQNTVTEPSIRYAAMAIGAMHRSHAFQKGISTASERKRALENYTKSLISLNSIISNNQASRDLVCLASLLFLVFDVSCGNDRGCLLHLNAGLRIVQSASEETSSSSSGYMYELVSIFSRLDIQAATFAPGHAAKVLKIPVIPHEFLSLVQARETIVAIIALMHYYLEPQGRDYIYHPRPSHAPAAHEIDEIKTLLAIWLEKFDKFIEFRSLKHTQRDHAAAKIVRISHIYASIFLDTFSVLRETLYDAYLPLFTKIVEYATFVIDLSEKTQTHSGRRLAFDIGTVQPLQFVASKCRNRTLRRRAIELAEKAGREGAWDGQNMAKVLRWVVAKEEKNLRPTEEEVALSLATFGDEMPEENDRLHGVQVDFDRLAQRFVIRTSRLRHSDHLDRSFEYLEGSIPWCGQQVDKDVEVGVVTGLMG